MHLVRPSACRSRRELVHLTYTFLEATHRTAIHSNESSNEQRYAIRTRSVCRGSLHGRLGVVLETAMSALMQDSPSATCSSLPPIPSSAERIGRTLLPWNQPDSSGLRPEPAVSAQADGDPIRRDPRRVSSVLTVLSGEKERACPLNILAPTHV